MIVTVPGYSSLAGNPETILKLMEAANFMDEKTGDDYINGVVKTFWRVYGIGLTVTGETYQERAESLLRELAKHEFITLEE